MLAISALILPGISGSFILLLLGMYTIIRSEAENALSTLDFNSILTIVVFGIGCLFGLVLFARFLSYTFKNYKNQTLAILTGFMLGSLNKIWPWRNPASWLDKESGVVITDTSQMTKELLLSDNIQLIKEIKVMPGDYLLFDPQVWICAISFIVGLGIVLLLDYKSTKKA
jgi:putative membrane protein